MAAVNRLRAVPKSRSPERQRLADAIAEYAAIRKEADALTEAIKTAHEVRREHERDVDAKTKAVEDAKENAASFATLKLLDKETPAPLSVKAARMALTDAQDELEVARETHAALLLRQSKMAGHASVGWARDKVARAAGAVIFTETASAIHERFERAAREYDDARRVLGFLEKISPPTLDNPFRDRLSSTSEIQVGYGLTGDGPWGAALLALQSDADARLPELK
jgi:hypothetical protein